MARPRLTFAYIVEPPDYQILACTLLASIRTHFGDDVAAVGYCPEHRMDELHPSVFKAHEIMQAELRPMRTQGMWDEDYPHGNKIIAAMQPRDSEYSAFVDSDVLFLRDNTPDNLIRADHVSCSAAASMTWAGEEMWDIVYGALDMEIPDERMEYMRRPRGPSIPYFSAGLVVFPEAPGSDSRFPDVWYDTARQIDRVESLEFRRPYLDQMSLPPAIRRAGLDWNILPEEQHYILGGRLRGEPLPEDRDIYTVHYRKAGILKEIGLQKYARGLLGKQTGVSFVRRLTDSPEKIKEGSK
ncbi:hypothetical protein ILP92_05690 [Maribius pontilimi]|uniref:Nucleotide-diphospho-sugar transferase n=1 Tax=Palleronia pontilimi TaxID=1964209 RepID=A0A934IEZ8_9RHOB|nr:hypothetical protein [Palleronia pontilimi]MBJ3762235.1 hypothetical protein [Palleronia pontilimi]